MMRFKNSDGFTLIEVLIALAIMASVFMPIYMLQGVLTQRVSAMVKYIDRLMQAKLFLIETSIGQARDVQALTLEKKVDNPSTTLKFELSALDTGSPLKKFKNLYQQQVQFEWTENGVKKSDRLVTFVFKPEPAKKV